MAEKRPGRPPSYSDELVLRGIEIVESQGSTPNGDTVKRILCEDLGVPGGINAQSLAGVVERLLQERDDQLNESLVKRLPEASTAAAAEIGARLTRDVTIHLAREYDRLLTAANKTLVEREEDLQLQRDQIRALQVRIEEKDSALAESELLNADLGKKLQAAQAKVSSLREQVSALRKAEDLEARVLASVSRVLANGHGETTPDIPSS